MNIAQALAYTTLACLVFVNLWLTARVDCLLRSAISEAQEKPKPSRGQAGRRKRDLPAEERIFRELEELDGKP